VSARDEILAQVSTAIGHSREHRTPIPRQYRVGTDDGLETFLDRLAHYDAVAHVVDAAELDQAVASILRQRDARTIVAPAGIPDAWLDGVEPLRDGEPPLDPDQLDAADGVLTTCATAIAQTGTIVLDGGAGMGRRALTLLPDYHLCVVRSDQLVSSVPEAIRRLETPTRPLTFISGPSATVDIEMTRVRGVHGPRRLEVIVAATSPIDQET
jgi:L-lactate dehydrogenase complex protein LldG